MNGREKIRQIKESILQNKLNQNHIPNVLTSLVFKLNKMCNLNCSYCYVDCQSGGPEMNLEVFKKVLSYIDLRKYSGDKKLCLILHGGEPLLSYNLVKQIVTYFNESNLRQHVIINLQSNGVLINQEIIDYFKENDIKLGISIDGHNDETNSGRVFYNGKNSFGAINKALDLCIQNNYKPGIGTVISNNNVDYLIELCEYLKNKGLTSYVFNVLVPHGRASNVDFPVDKYINASKKLYNWIKEQRRNGLNIVERNLDHLEKKIFNGGSSYMCMNAPCGAGINTLGFDLEGAIYICDQFVGDTDFVIGHINDNPKEIFNNPTSIDLVKKFQERHFQYIEDCQKCSYRYMCPMGCPAQVYYRDKQLKTLPPLCEYYKEMISFLIKNRNIKACSD